MTVPNLTPEDLEAIREFDGGETLREPIRITITPDDVGFIAQSIEFPLYGYGDTAAEAISSLKSELESLYVDLSMDDEFTDDWLKLKSSLLEKVSHE
jgi:hypothetical protein